MLSVLKLLPRRKLKKPPPRLLQKLRQKPPLKLKPLLKLPLKKLLKKLPLKLNFMRILKSYGTEGGVIVSTASIPEDFDITEPVFIDFDELPVPFFIEEFKAHGSKKAFLKLEDVDSLQDAEELVGKDIFFSLEEDDDFAGFTGLEVFDATTSKQVGIVKEYVDIPSNPCLEVEIAASGETVLIPCHDDLIDRVDEKKGRIFLRIPEGLL